MIRKFKWLLAYPTFLRFVDQSKSFSGGKKWRTADDVPSCEMGSSIFRFSRAVNGAVLTRK